MTRILGVPMSVGTYAEVVRKCIEWAVHGDSRVLVFANVHVIMAGVDDSDYLKCLERADMVNPDGVPLVWTLKIMGNHHATRVYGPDCTLQLLAAAAVSGVPVGFYGGSPKTMESLLAVVRRDNPNLPINYAVSPPFGPLSDEDNDRVIEEIAASGTRILFVGLGCPKQEEWMTRNAGRLPAVMLGVGAAFDFIAGVKPQAPRWMMRLGLEWLFRLCSEPRRLGRRYLAYNPRFIVLIARQLIFGESATRR